MGEKIRISRHGLTRCPTCTSHIRVEGSLDDTHCPFCDSSFPTSWFAGKPSPGKGTSSLSRAILMASMLGLPFAGCGDGGTPSNDTAADVAYDPGMQPAYGVPMDMIDPAPDDVPQQEYGIPMDLIGPAPDEGQQPEYGAPMDIVEPPDTSSQAAYGIPMDMVEPSPDEGFEPDYGLPPDAE